MSLEQEQATIQRRQRIAEMLMRQGAEPMETNQMAGGYVVPVSPLASVAKVAQQLAGAYTAKQADQEQAGLNERRVGKLVEAVQGGDMDYGKLAESGVDPGSIAKIIVDRQSKQAEMEARAAEKQREAQMPTTGQRDALYASGGDEAKARELLGNKIQNPLGMLNYQLQAGNVAADNARQEKQLGLQEQAAQRQYEQFQRQQELDNLKLEQERKAAAAGPKLTEGQAKASTFASQMMTASQAADKIEQSGFNPVDFKNQLNTMMAGGATNALASSDAQQYKQSQNQWAESFLRIKTGAAATPAEVDLNVKTFFPQLGDSPAVIRQKAAARKQAEQDVLSMAGPGAAAVQNRNTPVIGISANATPEDRAILEQKAKDAGVIPTQMQPGEQLDPGGGLTPDEQAELDQLRARFKK